jgi:formylglycine-generating enzyme required for sulfatase activity
MIEKINCGVKTIKKVRRTLLSLSICAALPLLLTASCWSDLDDMHGKIGYELHYAGEKITYTAGGISFKMSFVPGGRTFPMGVDDNGAGGDGITVVAPTATVAKSFWIAETEVTYELWYAVRVWAVDAARGANVYNFSNNGIMGNGGGSVTDQHPVTTINWRDAMVWTNALTEYYNANNGTNADLDCVYYSDSGYNVPIRSVTNNEYLNVAPGQEDNPYVKPGAKGFRMTGSLEWDMAARYRDGISWTPGNFASGATSVYTDFDATDLVAWFGNSLIYGIGNTTGTNPVKLKKENALGLYDMSGNVWEWCFDWGVKIPNDNKRSARGGAWNSLDPLVGLQVGRLIGQTDLWEESGLMGFRFARTD